MGYFVPSFVQKRILRYALSRLELFETRDLDLDNLDIVWGKRSTIELRDVGVSTSKISALIQLPPSLTLTKARILLLRITVPADLYNSGILIEVKGVQAHLDTETGDVKSRRYKARSTSSYRQAPSIRVNTPRALGDSSDDNARPESLPTTVELAQSFLQAEPPKERAEIKAAVADSQSIDQSETLSESTEDIDVLGVGGGISLPGFLADFLKGVVDRIQFTIGDFHLNLNTRIDLPADVSDSQEHSIKWENLTIRLSVERVDIDGITDQGSKPGSADGATESKPRVGEGANSRFRRAARRISLRNAQGMLISDTSLFANLSRVSMPSSPYATQSSTSKASDGRHHALNSKSGSNSSSPLSCRPKLRSALKTKSAERPGIPPTEITNVRPQDSMTDIAEYVRATTTGEHVSDSDFQIQYQDSVFTGSFYSDLGAIPASSYDSRGFVSGSDLSPLFSEGRTVVHESPAGYQAPAIALLGKSSPSPDNNTNNTYQTGSAGENLAESKIYSHEEAQSMYMSAMSQRSHQGDISYRNIPGNWDSSSSDDEISEPRVGVPTEPPIDQAQSASLTTPASSELKCIPSEIRDSPEPRQQIEGPKIKSPITPKPDAGLPAVANTSPVEQASSDKCESNSDTSDTVFLTVKNFLSINSITLDIPMNDHCVTDASKPLPQSHQSDSAKIPGSFSATSHQTSSQDGGQSGIALGLLQPSNTALAFGEEALKSSTSMLLEDVTILGDIGLTKLSGLLIQRLMDLNKQSPDKEKAIDPPAEVPSWTEIAVRRISWKFLDLVKGVTVPESHIAKFEAQVAEMPDDMDVLLQASVRDFQITVDREDYLTVLNSSIKKLTFGYAGDNIMAFDSGLKMRESNRDVLGPIDHDVILKVSQSLERTHIELTTLPLHIYLDLRRLDETFNWFGGFSGILGLGSSVISTVTVKESRAKAFTGAARPRGVHFENALQDVNQSASSRNVKLTARLGGIVFDVEGSSSTLGIETSAVKMVSRAEGVGLSVDRLNISGPYIASQRQEPSVKVRLSGLRAEYLNNPREIDLTRLLALLCPSKDNYDQDDDILVDTLLRQRRQGAVVRINADQLDTYINDIDDLKQLPALGEDLKKLSTVAKYLPEDDRPGIMTLMLLRSGMMELDTGSALGVFRLSAKGTEIAHISLPSLLALSMIEIELRRNGFEELIGVPLGTRSETDRSSPMIMTRYIGNELRPIVKLKLSGVRVEYHLATITAALGLSEEVGSERFMSDMVSSIATVTALPDVRRSPADLSIQALSRPEDSKLGTPPLGLDIVLKDVLLGLNPRDCPSRGIFLLSQAHIILAPSQDGELTVTFEMDKSAFLAVDDVGSLHSNPGSPSLIAQDTLTKSLLAMGYVSLSEISAAKVSVNLLKFGPEGGTSIDAELRDALVVLESCADSTQTMQSILNGLQPPSPPTKHQKYRTEIMPVEDMLASFSGEAFPAKQAAGGASHGLPDESPEANDEDGQDLEFVSSFYEADPFGEDGTMSDSMLEASLESLPDLPSQSYTEDQKPLITSPDHVQIDTDESTLDFREDHFGNSSKIGGTAHRWDTKRNTYDLADDSRLRTSPFRVRVRGVHIIWNLFDGYDWQHTRDTIDQAVTAVEDKAAERRSNRNKRRSLDVEEDEDSVIGDFLFNSIYIGISGKQDPKDLTRQINRNIDDLVSETESYATFASSNSPSRKGGAPRAHKRKLRLMRSKSHKLTFEVKGLSVDMVAFPPGSGETQNSIDVRVQDLEIFDHLPSSTWKKFATYMHDAGERESGSSMVHLEILNVKPVPDLAASEIILKATILPLRLHVDQDALDFMTRFFEFRDDSIAPSPSKTEPPFLQRVEVKSIRVKLDFKPKRVDYAGLRSGHTTEFMNFFILDQADMVLRRVIIHGVSGFDKLGKMLNDIWSPDVKNNQLPGVLAGLAPVRSLANVSGGVRDLVVVPIREYKKDGRVVRSIQKGALAFAKTTTSELARLGAKLAINTQTVLQSANDLLEPEQHRADVAAGWEDADMDEEEKKQISLYADQPVGVMQGLRGGYASLERDLLLAKDAIIAMPGEVMDSGSAGGAARAVLRGAPTVILRPALGVSKAVGQTLMGATNSLDPANRKRIDDKYKRH